MFLYIAKAFFIQFITTANF